MTKPDFTPTKVSIPRLMEGLRVLNQRISEGVKIETDQTAQTDNRQDREDGIFADSSQETLKFEE